MRIDFDLGATYDFSTFHFWNYVTENYDVDRIDFVLSDARGGRVAEATVYPETGVDLGGELIAPGTLAFKFAAVRFVSLTFSGTNNHVDFNNLGWTGTRVSPVAPDRSAQRGGGRSGGSD